MATPQDKALQTNGHNKGGLVGKLKGLMGAKHFGETKQGRKLRKKHEKMSGADLF